MNAYKIRSRLADLAIFTLITGFFVLVFLGAE
jgi:hypothetical protein